MNLPVVMLVGEDEGCVRALAAAAADGGWAWHSVRCEDDLLSAVRVLRPDLLLLACATGAGGIEAVRGAGGSSAETPILAIAATGGLTGGADAIIADDHDPAALPALLERWRLPPENTTLERLADVFGAPEVRALCDAFAVQLRDVLHISVRDADCREAAHKLAGLAGTLGFTAVFAAWRLVAEGVPGALPDARRCARLVLHGLCRDRRAAGSG